MLYFAENLASLLDWSSIGPALVDHEVIVMPVDYSELVIMISCRTVAGKLLLMHMLVEVLNSVDRP